MNETERRQRMQAYFNEVRAHIKKYGWSATSVFPTEEDPGFRFTYSIGFTDLGHPEMVVTDLSPEQAHGVLADAYDAIRTGHRFTDGERTDKLCQAPFTFGIRAVPGDGHPANVARAIYNSDIRLLQAVWPDEENRMPWDEDWDFPSEQTILDLDNIN